MKTPYDPRHQARRIAISYIYSYLLGKTNKQEIHSYSKDFQKTLKVKSYDDELLRKITEGVKKDFNNLKKVIEKHSENWDFSSIYKVDASILLCAIWELQSTDTSKKVIVDEAVELAKEFGNKESAKFINGILAGVIN